MLNVKCKNVENILLMYIKIFVVFGECENFLAIKMSGIIHVFSMNSFLFQRRYKGDSKINNRLVRGTVVHVHALKKF